MLAFNRVFIEFGAAVRGLERTDDVLGLLWRDWTSTCEGGAGWWEFGLEVLSRIHISTANLKGDHLDSPHTNDLLFRHDYGIDIILRRQDAAPAYGGWIMSTGMKISGRFVHDHRAILAEGGESGLEISYTYDPSPGFCVYRPENRALDLVGMRRLHPQWRKRPPLAGKGRKAG